MLLPKKVAERIVAAMKQMRPIIELQKQRDVSEADTVTLVKDLLSDVFGYDKYAELTSEFAIRGTYCDLAVKIENKLVLLIEVKAIGIELDDRHVKQAVDYAANQGVEWVVLTNAQSWRLYHIIFAQPIDKKLISQIDLLSMDVKSEEAQDSLAPYTKEGFRKGMHLALKDKQDATSRFLLSALLLHNDSLIAALRRELRRVVDVNVEESDIIAVLKNEVIKRDAMEGPEAESAAKLVNRKESAVIRKSRLKEEDEPQPTPAAVITEAAQIEPPKDGL